MAPSGPFVRLLVLLRVPLAGPGVRVEYDLYAENGA